MIGRGAGVGGVRGLAPGFTLIETLVTLLLSYLLIALALGTLARQRELVGNLAARAERLAAVRLTRHVLLTEAREGAGDRTWAVGPDSLALRAFRGHALACPGTARGREIEVRAEGVRAPDPAKDSVLVLLTSGRVEAMALLGRVPSAGPCLGRVEPTERWTLSDPAPLDAVAARWFERGTYYLADGALRYRRGQAGRQPLTPEVLSRRATGFRPGPRAVGLVLVVDPPPAPPEPWSFTLSAPFGG